MQHQAVYQIKNEYQDFSSDIAETLILENPAVLPFVSVFDDRPVYWTVSRTGDYSEQNARGRGYADALISFMYRNRCPNVLLYVLSAERFQWGAPLETGFVHRLAERAIIGYQHS